MSQVYSPAEETADASNAPAVTLRPGVMILDLREVRRVMSSAPFGGGLTSSRYLTNYTVSNDFCSDDTEASIRAMLLRDGLPVNATTCTLTAVDVARCQFASAREADVRASIYVTVGLGNLTAPGLTPLATRHAGTINIFALINADLPDAALVETIQIITEVKVRHLAGRSTPEGFPATGTSTDTVTVALLPGPREQYAGAVTAVGRALACATDTALTKAL